MVSSFEGSEKKTWNEYVTHPLCVSVILAELEAEPECILAGMMCDVLQKTNAEPEGLKIPERVREMIQEVNRAREGNVEKPDKEVLLVMVAERLHNMRTIAYMEEDAGKRKAEETLEIFLPMAAKLGNKKLMAELNDLALKYLKLSCQLS